jgi:predicted nucleic acid-binding protein
MKLVVNANILFSFFKEDSSTRELICRFEILELFTPSFCIEEILKYKKVICKKSGISEKSFEKALNELKVFVKIVPVSEYSAFLKKAVKISPDPDDADFFALALKLGCPIWSNDSKLKRQSEVNVVSTKELMEFLSKVKP